MLRPILTLLLAVPLLLPPGFCLCRLETLLPQRAQETQPSKSRKSCSCCRQRSRGDKRLACPPDRRVSYAGTTSEMLVATKDRPQPVSPHAPACPAHPGWCVTRAADVTTRTAELPTDLAVATASPLPDVPSAVPASQIDTGPLKPSTLPPLHRILRC